MSLFPKFSKSDKYKATYPELAFGMTLISGCRNYFNPPGFDQYKRKLLRKMRRRETLARITQRIETYKRYFESFGYECPLPKHLKRTVNSGFPRYNLMVDTHFMAEMCAGILVAVTDYNYFEGELTLDLADDGEICQGMGNRRLITKKGEIVFRDEKDIVCVLCQGADEKTRVRDDTQNVFLYGYAVPGIEGKYLKEGLAIAADTMAEYGGGDIEGLNVF